MRILLQDRTTRMFFREPGSWVADAESAQCYGSSVAALRCALQQRFHDAQIVLKFPAESYDIILSVGAEHDTVTDSEGVAARVHRS